ncbi:invasion protein CiaB [Hydrogenimonas cancrithermarum]|uniref:Invasion antigen B n=1 Tax=Hydrogenimonas cancrithermarum TaxID=2993563 RepID=A0ABN6WVB5_9BACT|nr:invasion protein CiaB [Hydrogenimonas cancrithermarum]BDY12825.1 invasion antigen B [Hydrogenimonas cancrithermarum]BDY12942.1 invasion antigen B [Hydrogenimonas cancrithermarum]
MRETYYEVFMEDLQTLYNEILRRQKELGSYYDLLGSGHAEAEAWIGDFLRRLELPETPETRMAALTRLIGLRDDALAQVLEKEGREEKAIIEAKESAYKMVADFYLKRHLELLDWIEDEALLTPFYREILKEAHRVGEAMSTWQSAWTAHIIHGVNRELFELFNGDEEKIYEMLESEDLLDLREEGCVGDRCYSVLKKTRKGFKSVPYAKAFRMEVQEVVNKLTNMRGVLATMEDEVFGQQAEWLAYIDALIDAFSHTETEGLIKKWAEVDRKWMAITAPIQIGHPLEYYEDHYRKAVALEWDVRLASPKLMQETKIPARILEMSEALAHEFGEEAREVNENCARQVERTQLYIGIPALFYGAEFQGLFSAQVVPNDTEVSRELGKKIFAFADNVLESKKARPVMRIARETFGDDFVLHQRTVMLEKPELWHKVYEITTIGHEYGHVLWVDDDTETKMNGSGNYKNVEEFKATTGGLMAFFMHEDETLQEEILRDTVARAVSLMSWRKTGEVEPYYVEGLLHLDILFEAGVLGFDGEKLSIDLSDGAYRRQKALYRARYIRLVHGFYLPKRDAGGFLASYVEKKDGVWLPKNETVRTFVDHYWNRYLEIGQETMPFEEA